MDDLLISAGGKGAGRHVGTLRCTVIRRPPRLTRHKQWRLYAAASPLAIEDPKRRMPEQEVLLEFRRVGKLVKVTAVDPVSLTEVTIQGPASAPQSLSRKIIAEPVGG